MSTHLVHISDLHLRENWHEEQGVVLNGFFDDLQTQIKDCQNVFAIFSGDILQEGSRSEHYRYFNNSLGRKFNELGITRDRLIVVPGNHDIDRNYTSENFTIFKSLQERKITETDFNNNIYGSMHEQFKMKFLPFLKWQESVTNMQFTESNFCGCGFNLTDNIGIYCLNTALCSFGGLKDENQNIVSDYKELHVETRKLNKWILQSDHKFRILTMHHPISWLSDWAQEEIGKLCYQHFDLVLSGHVHKKDSSHIYNGVDSYIHCSAPQLFSKKTDILGYSILTITDQFDAIDVHYRQWAYDRFVTGTFFSRNDNGTVRLSSSREKESSSRRNMEIELDNRVLSILNNNLERCLKCYASLPAVWVLPNVADRSEFSSDEKSTIIETADAVRKPFRDCIIVAPRQFGLSSLGHYLSLAEWREHPGKYVMYIDSKQIQNHETAIERYVQTELEEIGLSGKNLAAIILDVEDSLKARMVNNIKKLYKNIPLVILVGRQDNEIGLEHEDTKFNTDFETIFLWSLERNQMREIVQKFVDSGYDLQEEAALDRLVEDLANLNVHRTPLNCLTLLAVYASGIDYSPVNRTDMFERFLFLIFFAYKKLPDYSSVPDMKDALAVIGAFCEKIIRERRNLFAKSDFVLSSTKFCESMSINVDCSQLFEIMYRENIIVGAGESFYFRYVHWVYFFGAHRMHHSSEFCSFVLNDAYYMNFPEIIEFYSGVDRRRKELLEILTQDLQKVNEEFEVRTGIEEHFDPYSVARWALKGSAVGELRNHLREEANRSSMPVDLKDKIADSSYDKSAPYDQSIRTFVRDSSLLECMQIVRAASRALRNSDYVEAEVKSDLLAEIMRGWVKELQVLVMLSPVIARQRFAIYDQIKFFLGAGFEDFEGEELWHNLLGSIPSTVVSEFDKDIASQRLTPLFHSILKEGESGPAEFILTGVIIKCRPEKWEELVFEYIRGIPKNSFYLLKVYELLYHEYKYGFLDKKSREQVFEAISMAIAKHETGAKNPNKSLVKKVKMQIRDKLDRD